MVASLHKYTQFNSFTASQHVGRCLFSTILQKNASDYSKWITRFDFDNQNPLHFQIVYSPSVGVSL